MADLADPRETLVFGHAARLQQLRNDSIFKWLEILVGRGATEGLRRASSKSYLQGCPPVEDNSHGCNFNQCRSPGPATRVQQAPGVPSAENRQLARR